MTKKRIFITGMAGFIGFHMALYFHQRGDSVMGYDNFNPYYDPRLKRARAAVLAKLGISVIEGDLRDQQRLTEAVEDHQPTHFLHLAAQAGVRHSLSHPHTYLQSNIEGFLNVLEVCRLLPGMPLVYASSSSVYGNNRETPFSISDRTDHPTSFYGVTKKTNEMMAQVYHDLFGIPVTGLRFFTVYGPWGRPDMAYFYFARAISEGRPIELFNYGYMERDFTHIQDIVSGTAAAVDRSYPHALFNLGHHRPETLLDLIALLERELGLKAQKIFSPMQLGDMLTTHADIKESIAQLGFIPKVSLEEGIKDFVKWYKEDYPRIGDIALF